MNMVTRYRAFAATLFVALYLKTSAQEHVSDAPSELEVRSIKVVNAQGQVCMKLSGAESGGIISWYSTSDATPDAGPGEPHNVAWMGQVFDSAFSLVVYSPDRAESKRGQLLSVGVEGKPARAQILGMQNMVDRLFYLGGRSGPPPAVLSLYDGNSGGLIWEK